MTQKTKRRVKTLSLLVLFGVMMFLNPGLVQANGIGDPVLTIPEIQGDGFTTPYAWQEVKISGIVTADYQAEGKNGFFLQDPIGDGNPATSDGIFVYEPAYYDSWPYYGIFHVNLGDEITIVGRAREYYDLTQLDRVQEITIESTGNPLPDPVELNPPFDDDASDVYYEKLEGMLVSVAWMRTVAGTNPYGEAAGVVWDTHVKRVFQDDPAGTGEIIFTDDAGGCLVSARTGSIIKNLVGPLDYSFDEYKVLPSADNPPLVLPKWWAISDIVGPKGLRSGFTVATYNMYNLFDEFDDPGKDDTPEDYPPEYVELMLSKHAHAIKDILRLPDLVAVQEVENIAILERLIDTEPIKGIYGAVLVDGPDERGIDVGLLYRLDRVEFISAWTNQTCTDNPDQYGPGTDPNFPCDPGFNPLFSRPPLVVHLKTIVKSHWCKSNRYRSGTDLWVIINHFKSKGVYHPPPFDDPEPRRIEQATWVNGLVDEIQDGNPWAKIIVLGDLNSFNNEAPIDTLQAGGLYNLINSVRKRNRYTYIYRGVSEVLDYIMVSRSLRWRFIQSRIVHFNVDFPYGIFADDPTTGISSSDHDVFMCSFWIR